MIVGTRVVDLGLKTVLVVYNGPIEAGGDVGWGLNSLVIVTIGYVDSPVYGVGLGVLTGG